MEEERVNNDLLLDQFAIVAKPNKSFAMYRVDPPYKPITDHLFRKRMGEARELLTVMGHLQGGD